MTSFQTTLIWQKLLIDGSKFVTSDAIGVMAEKFGKDEERSLRYLQEHGYVLRVLRGIFYVMSPEEIEGGYRKYSIYEMVSEALRFKGVKNWYFGLETALKMNRMTHEFFTVDYVITDSFRTTKTIGILDSRFVFTSWKTGNGPAPWKLKRITDHGCALFHSDKERTVLDLSYRSYLRKESLERTIGPIIEFEDQINKDRVKGYLTSYPPKFRETITSGSVL